MNKKSTPITIYAEMTPNPNTMRFVSNKRIIDSDGNFEFFDAKELGSGSLLIFLLLKRYLLAIILLQFIKTI